MGAIFGRFLIRLNCHPVEQHLLLRHHAHLAPDLDDPDLPQDRLLGVHLQVLPRQEHHQHADLWRRPHRAQRRRHQAAYHHLQGGLTEFYQVFYMLFERSHFIIGMKSLKQHMKY